MSSWCKVLLKNKIIYMKKSIILASLVFTVFSVNAQKYFTKEGKVYFHSKTQMEKIEATN